ncbi:hypothetical protein FIBSPDRAFT_105218 [Athelia psychrophila]|uniref:Uncharacterized protein n=1 Tax=Athelia psychrophila TaxID=1759441 RepID=A0A166DAZ3_9AGAM|nr:hypothetical protein FIBSPDRAFT_105218 [Fibularhizoctonia sp. CBS 109695]
MFQPLVSPIQVHSVSNLRPSLVPLELRVNLESQFPDLLRYASATNLSQITAHYGRGQSTTSAWTKPDATASISFGQAKRVILLRTTARKRPSSSGKAPGTNKLCPIFALRMCLLVAYVVGGAAAATNA